MPSPNCNVLTVAVLLLAAFARPVHAHFPWLDTDREGQALLFFGENPQDRTYHMPEAVAEAEVFARTAGGESKPIELAAVEEDDFVGRRSSEAVPADAALESTIQYGLYHGMLLTYYAKHLPGDDAAVWEKLGDSNFLRLEVMPKPADEDGPVALVVTWEGKPLEGAEVTLADASGDTHEGETDQQGTVSFEDVPAGLVGVTANKLDKVEGELDGEPYTSEAHFATLTFQHGDRGAAASAEPADNSTAGALPSLPEPVASFGAATTGGYLYVYSGHIGEEHEHSKENLSQHFRRVSLAGAARDSHVESGAWEELPMQTPLQSVALLAHGGKLYRVGGMTAHNAADEEEDIHSVDEFACYDPDAEKWTALAPLPEPRSSHDAVVIGDVLYVVGGWTLSGSSKGEWVDTAWSFDLTTTEGEWQAVPSPGFRRRALAVSHWNGKLVALGGMNENRKISRRVDALDLESGEWTRLAKLPGEGMDGFGAAACNQNRQLYASGTQESLLRLADDGQSWIAVAKMTPPRFFHRLVPGAEGALLAVGGASEEGHLATIEVLDPEG